MVDAREHCCPALRSHLQVSVDGTVQALDRPVVYDPVFDEYALESAPRVEPWRYCPWCGAALPPSKRDRWYAEVARLDLSPEHPDLPAALRSDEWWQP
jgi:hypothetical protein